MQTKNGTERGGAILNALVLLGAVNFVIIVLAVLTLVVMGVLNINRLEIMRGLFATAIDDDRKELVLDAFSARIAVGEKPAGEITELEKQIQRAGGRERFLQQLRRDMERQRESIRPELARLEETTRLHQETLAELDLQKGILAAERAEFEAGVKAWRDEAASTGFEENIARIEKMDPVDVADIVLAWEDAESLRYLAALAPKFAAKILTEMKAKQGGDVSVAELLKKLGEGEPAVSIGRKSDETSE